MSKESTHSIMGIVVFRPGVLFQCALKGPARKGKTKRDRANGYPSRRVENKKACAFQNSALKKCDGCPAHG